jgi:hypothetical protein
MASCATFNTIDSEVVIQRHFSASCPQVRNLIVSIVESAGLRLLSETRAGGNRYILAASRDSALDEPRFRSEFVLSECEQRADSVLAESALRVGVEVWDGVADRWTRCLAPAALRANDRETSGYAEDKARHPERWGSRPVGAWKRKQRLALNLSAETMTRMRVLTRRGSGRGDDYLESDGQPRALRGRYHEPPGSPLG